MEQSDLSMVVLALTRSFSMTLTTWLHSRRPTPLSQVFSASVQYSSGDVIAVTTGVAALGGGFTKVNVGSALPSIAILTTLTAVSTSALAESLYGNTVVGNISVYDTDGNAGTDGDLIIGISGGANRTKAVGIRIIGGDELITTTKIGKQSASLVNITVAQQGTLGYNITLG